jgi:hypothetical protein
VRCFGGVAPIKNNLEGELMKWKYVAHPYGGKPENKDKVEQIIKELARENPLILYISPMHVIGFLYNDVDYMQGMKYCFDLLNMCNELILCEGWENSRGCNLEKKFAETHGIPIKYLSR